MSLYLMLPRVDTLFTFSIVSLSKSFKLSSLVFKLAISFFLAVFSATTLSIAD